MVYVKPRTGQSTVYKVKSVLRGTEVEGKYRESIEPADRQSADLPLPQSNLMIS